MIAALRTIRCCWLMSWMALLAFASPTLADGEQIHDADGYRIHYSAIPSTAIGESVARHYGITRDDQHGLLTVSVLRKSENDGDEQAVRARIQAVSQTLIGQRQTISLREAGNDDFISYIGEFRIRGEDTLRFELTVQPEGHGRAIPVRFQQHLVGR